MCCLITISEGFRYSGWETFYIDLARIAMKSFLYFITSIVLLIMLITGRHIAHSPLEILCFWFFIILWGFISFNLLPDKIIKLSPLLTRYDYFIKRNDILIFNVFLIFGLLFFIMLFISYSFEEPSLNYLRLFFILFFSSGIFLILINMFKTKPWRNKRSGKL